VAAYLSGNNVTSYELGFKRDLAKIAAFFASSHKVTDVEYGLAKIAAAL
jgi:hypothetical protein